MTEPREFSFSDDSVAQSYDTVLVPLLFEPWARRLADDYEPWLGSRVLDLATGTGIVARVLADRVGPQGSVIGVDMNDSMLALARQRCHNAANVEFRESPACPLDVPDNSVDAVVCQQGFQFFPDKSAAACEIHRVLRPGGRVIATTWRPVSECEYMGIICEAAVEIGEPELAEMMKVPFDFMPATELGEAFEAAGFAACSLGEQRMDAVFRGGVQQAVDTVYATPIGPKLEALPENKQADFRQALAERVGRLRGNGTPVACMVTNVLTAQRPA